MGQDPGAHSQLLIHVSVRLSITTRGESRRFLSKGDFTLQSQKRDLFGGFATNKDCLKIEGFVFPEVQESKVFHFAKPEPEAKLCKA